MVVDGIPGRFGPISVPSGHRWRGGPAGPGPKADPKPDPKPEPAKTFTQEGSTGLSARRLAREREKYADYDELRQAKARLDGSRLRTSRSWRRPSSVPSRPRPTATRPPRRRLRSRARRGHRRSFKAGRRRPGRGRGAHRIGQGHRRRRRAGDRRRAGRQAARREEVPRRRTTPPRTIGWRPAPRRPRRTCSSRPGGAGQGATSRNRSASRRRRTYRRNDMPGLSRPAHHVQPEELPRRAARHHPDRDAVPDGHRRTLEGRRRHHVPRVRVAVLRPARPRRCPPAAGGRRRPDRRGAPASEHHQRRRDPPRGDRRLLRRRPRASKYAGANIGGTPNPVTDRLELAAGPGDRAEGA